MDNFEIVTLNEPKRWQEIVTNFDDFDVFYHYSYAKSCYINGEGVPYLFHYCLGNTKAINVFLKRDISFHPSFTDKISANTLFDISTPYGYGGLLVQGSNKQLAAQAYSEYCKRENFVSEFVRFHLTNNSENFYIGERIPVAKNIIRSLDLSIDDILQDFDYKVRKNLRKAEANNLTIEIIEDGERVDEFIELYYSTMDRTGANASYYYKKRYFETINEMRGNIAYFFVRLGDRIISAELVLYGNKNCYSFLGGTDKDFFYVRPNEFLKFQIIKWGMTKGL